MRLLTPTLRVARCLSLFGFIRDIMSSARAMAGMMKQLYRCAQDIASSSRSSSPITMRVATVSSMSKSHHSVNASTLARSLMTASTANGASIGLSSSVSPSLHRSLSHSAPMLGRMAAMSFSSPPSLPPHHDTSHLEKGAPAVDGLLSDASAGSGGAAGGSLSLEGEGDDEESRSVREKAQQQSAFPT